MAEKKGKTEVKNQAGAPKSEQKPVAKSEVIFVNSNKFERATEIVALVSGKRVPRKPVEAERKQHWSEIMAESDVNPKAESAVRFVYEKLGGLVRTRDEQAEADRKAAEARKQNKKRKIEADK